MVSYKCWVFTTFGWSSLLSEIQEYLTTNKNSVVAISNEGETHHYNCMKNCEGAACLRISHVHHMTKHETKDVMCFVE